MQFLSTAPANNDRSPRYMEKAFAAIHQSLPRHSSFVVSFRAADGQTGLYINCAHALRHPVLNPIEANYPSASIVAAENMNSCEGEIWTSHVRLVPELFPILRHAQFEDSLARTFADPLSTILDTLRRNELIASVEITLRPASHSKVQRAIRAVKLLDREFFRSHHRVARFYAKRAINKSRFILWPLVHLAKKSRASTHTILDTTGSRIHDREDDIQAASDKIGGHLFEATMQITVRVPLGQKQVAIEAVRTIGGALGAFTSPRLATFRTGKPSPGPTQRTCPSFLVSHEELATLWHPPTATVATDRLHVSEFQELPPPVLFNSERESGGVVLGRVCYREDFRPVELALEDRRRHLYIVGKTGMGKTTLLQNMIVDDIAAGRGVCLVDPHGDLAEMIVGLVPKHRTNDVILFDAASRECCPPRGNVCSLE